MIKKLAEMDAGELKDMIEYMVRHDTGSTVQKVKKELGLTEEEYQELYELSMPAIRHANGEWYWKIFSSRIISRVQILIQNHRAGFLPDAEKALNRIEDIVSAKSLYGRNPEKKEGAA